MENIRYSLRILFAVFTLLAASISWADPPPPDTWNTVGGSKSKLSIHAGWGPWTSRFTQNAQPRVVKLLDECNEEHAAWIKRTSPHTIVVGRIYEHINTERRDGDPVQRAREWWSRQGGRIMAAPSVDYWEGYNEPAIWNGDQMTWYANFEAERVRILTANGKKAVIANFSVGHPDLSLWPLFFPAIDEALRNKGVLGLHEYGKPMQQDWDAANNEGWRVGRYRKIYKQHLIPNNRKIPLIITETGVDIGGNPTTDGWRQWYNADQYMEQLRWYDSVMQQDNYVVGATIFALEIPGWASFDISTVMDRLETHVRNGNVTYGSNGSTNSTPLPDVLVEDVWVEPANPSPGQAVKVFARIRNAGNATTGNVVGVGFRINNESRNNWWHTEQAMVAGEVKTFRMDSDYTLAGNATGLTVVANVDDINRFPESNENNNVLSKNIAIGNAPPSSGGNSVDPNAQWRLISLNSNKALDIEAVSLADGAKAHQWDYVKGNNQRWKIQATTGNFFRLVAVHSGKCLDNSNPSGGNGTVVHQWSCHGGQNQNWQLRSKGNGVFDLVNASGGRCLDVEGARKDNGAKTHMWDCHGRNNQLWRIEKLNSNGDAVGILQLQDSQPPPTISVQRVPSPMKAGQNQTVTWTTANATAVSVNCTANGTGFKGSATLSANGSRTGIASQSWIGYPSTCIWKATGPGGSKSITETLKTVAATPAPTITVNRTPNPRIVGQTNTVTWSTTNANSVKYQCTASGTGYKGTATRPTNGSASSIGNAAWVGYPSTCIWTVTGPGGTITYTETVTTIPASAALVSGIGRNYQLGTLNNGQPFFIDRSYTLTNVPSAHAGATMIKTANGDKGSRGNWLGFTLGQTATVHVAFDNRATAIPAWLSSWERTTDLIGTSDTPFRVYRRSFPAGSITLGGNADTPMAGARSNYFVFVKSGGTPSSTPTPSGIEWDSRLTQLHVSVETAANKSGGYWKLVSARFENDRESGGNHNIYILLKDANGNPITQERNWTVTFPGQSIALKTKPPYNGQIQWGDYPIYGKSSPYNPLVEAGPFSAWVGTATERGKSDVVKGMGSFYCDTVGSYYHSSFKLTYQWIP